MAKDGCRNGHHAKHREQPMTFIRTTLLGLSIALYSIYGGASAVFAKVCSNDEVVALAKQGFSKTDIVNLCENQKAGIAPDQLTEVVIAGLSSRSTEELLAHMRRIITTGLQSDDPWLTGYVSGGWTVRIGTKPENCGSTARRPAGGGNYEDYPSSRRPLNCLKLAKRFSESRSTAGVAECDKAIAMIRESKALLVGDLSHWWTGQPSNDQHSEFLRPQDIRCSDQSRWFNQYCV